MKYQEIHVEKVLHGQALLEHCTITFDEHQIVDISQGRFNSGDSLAGILLPGFIDVQVNGGGGRLFNNEPTTTSLDIIARAHQSFGTTGWLPTIITDCIDTMTRAADAVASTIQNNSSSIMGIHFEGPHLSTEKNGVHSVSHIRSLSEAELALYQRKDIGQVVVTIAPEMVTPDVIKTLVNSGVIVCLGHSNATHEQVVAALDAGATGFTHLFNAMSALTSREPGMVGSAFLDKTNFAGIIMDGIHVHPAVAKLAHQFHSRLMLVTDAMATVGAEDKTFELFGERIEQQGNTLRNSDGRLAGAAIDMLSCFYNAMDFLDIELITASSLASLNPARFLGLTDIYGTLEIGKKASMVMLNENRISHTWVNGTKVYG